MTKETKFAFLGIWSIVKTLIVCAGLAYFLELRVTDLLSIVAIWYVWSDRVMKEEAKDKRKRKVTP